jgi:hypothetical protein
MQEYKHLIKGPDKQLSWTTSFANKLGQLSQGLGSRMPKGTKTVFFISK